MGEAHFTPWSFQRQVLASTARYTVVPAGTGTGKTVVGPFWLYDRIAKWPQDEFLVVVADDNSAQGQVVNKVDGLVRVFCDVLGIGEYVASLNIIRLKTGGTVYIRSAKAPRTLHSIHARAVWMDEAGLIDDVAADVALGSAGQKSGDYLVTGYPQSSGGWYRKLIDRGLNADPSVNVIRVSTADSPYVDPAEVEEMRRRLPGWKAAMLLDGDFSRALGSIFDPLPVGCIHDDIRARLTSAREARGDAAPVTDTDVEHELDRIVQYYGGADGGWAITAGVLIAWEGDRCWWLGGYKSSEQPVDVNSAGFKTAGLGRAIRIFGDPAASAIWHEYLRQDLRIADATKGPGSVEAGITRMVEMVRTGMFTADRCALGLADLRKEWDGYRWVTDADGNVVINRGRAEPVKEHGGDDLIDSTGFALTSSRRARTPDNDEDITLIALYR